MQTGPTLLANNTQHCWAQQCCDLLHPFAWNHNNVGFCWHLLRIVWNRSNFFRPMQTDATLLANNTQQCWELLALVESVCMGLKKRVAIVRLHWLPFFLCASKDIPTGADSCVTSLSCDSVGRSLLIAGCGMDQSGCTIGGFPPQTGKV